MKLETLRYERRDDGVAVLTLDRVERHNAIDEGALTSHADTGMRFAH